MTNTATRTRKLSLGKVVATPGAITLLEKYAVDAQSLMERHEAGDWGVLTLDDWRANNDAVAQGLRVLSCYAVGLERLWIITEADRSVTTLLLPQEY